LKTFINDVVINSEGVKTTSDVVTPFYEGNCFAVVIENLRAPKSGKTGSNNDDVNIISLEDSRN